MTKTKNELQREQISTSSNFLTSLPNEKETTLTHMIRIYFLLRHFHGIYSSSFTPKFPTILFYVKINIRKLIVRNFVKEELYAHEAVFQEIVSSNLKVTNERLEKLCGKVSNIIKSLEFT